MKTLDAAEISVPDVDVRVVEHCRSTNSVLMQEGRLARPLLLVAETQTAGRGRRGRRWHSTPGGITFSLARAMRRPARELSALSLVAGVAAARALRAIGAPVSLKWPNDLVCPGGKLGGILVETRAPSRAVVGVGINYAADAGLGSRVRRPVASLQELLPLLPPRSRIIQEIACALTASLDAFEAEGFEAAREEWLTLDAYAGQRLRVRLAGGRSLTGVAAGLAEDGALRLQTRRGLRSVRNGTVRPVQAHDARAA
jgi:BirA family transcriptional regulator, biotin operon repressor / biotin---[acetyl-CoA-carboxylase] ligase